MHGIYRVTYNLSAYSAVTLHKIIVSNNEKAALKIKNITSFLGLVISFFFSFRSTRGNHCKSNYQPVFLLPSYLYTTETRLREKTQFHFKDCNNAVKPFLSALNWIETRNRDKSGRRQQQNRRKYKGVQTWI